MALDLSSAELIDPHGGADDLEARRLRCVGEPEDRLREDPLRVLRAARLVSEWGFEADPQLEEALVAAAPSLEPIPAVRQRRELYRLLVGEHVEQALLLLRRTGVERAMVRGVRSDSPALVASMPRQLELRLAAWLRGTRPRGLLRRLRFGLARSRQVERLLEHHPLDKRVTPSRDRALLRLLRQLDEDSIAALFFMREWELARTSEDDDVDRARKRLEAVRGGIDRVLENRSRSQRRTELALDGRTVMQLLGCGPGRRVGAALRFLSEWAGADPARNDPDALRAAVLDWANQNPDPQTESR
jgi:tRNA nucleotidyltransferase (CCA-adding enzyme)